MSQPYKIHLTEANRAVAVEATENEQLAYEIDGLTLTIYEKEIYVNLVLEAIYNAP